MIALFTPGTLFNYTLNLACIVHISDLINLPSFECACEKCEKLRNESPECVVIVLSMSADPGQNQCKPAVHGLRDFPISEAIFRVLSS